MADVVPIGKHEAFERSERQSVGRTLRQAREAKLSQVLIIGVDEEGDLFVKAHPADPGGAFWLMERAKRLLVP